MTKVVPSRINSNFVFMSTSNGNFVVFDVRGVGEITMKEKLHSDAIMDFELTVNEDYVLTSSLDRTINLTKLMSLEI